MRFSRLIIGTGVAFCAAQAALAGVVFTEDFTGSPLGVLSPVFPATGSFTSGSHTYTTFGSAASNPTLAITDFSGDLRLDNTAATNTTETHIVTSMTTIDSDKVVTIEFDAYDSTNAATSNQRFYVLVENATTKDGYRLRFSSQNASEQVLNATLYNGGVEVADRKFDDEVDGPLVFGTPNVAGAWHVKMSFIKSGTDVIVSYEVTGIGATPNLVAANTFTFDETTFPGVNSIRDDFDQVDIWTRRPIGQMDNISVTVDTEVPVITLLGSPTVTLECGATYADAGATALDNFSGNLTSSIVTVNPVNTSVPAVYNVTYNVVDQSSNAATQVTRVVTVQDTVDPLVSLVGADPITISCGAAFSDPGATASDTCSGALTPVVTGTVDTVTPGDYTLTYTATDGAGNDAAVTRTVTVLNDCPAILISPTTATTASVQEGDGPVTFGISAAGTGTLSYLWYFDDGAKAAVSLPAETASSITLAAPITLAQAGIYYCEVTDDFSTISSPNFTLNVAAQVPVAGALGMIAAAAATALSGLAALRRKR